MTNPPTAAPGVAVEVARLMALINDYVGDRVGLETMPGHAEPEAFERASDRVSTKESELESALSTALLASAEGGQVDAAAICDAEGQRWRKEAQKHLPHHNSDHAKRDFARAEICEGLAKKIRAAHPPTSVRAAQGVTDEQIDAVFSAHAGANDFGAAYLRTYKEGFRHIARSIINLAATPANAAPVEPTNDSSLHIKVTYYQNEGPPSIYWCHGNIAGDVLSDIEEEMVKRPEDILDKGFGDYEFKVTRDPGQYGDYGICEMAPYWDFTDISFAKEAS
jgi:hypothetical protein